MNDSDEPIVADAAELRRAAGLHNDANARLVFAAVALAPVAWILLKQTRGHEFTAPVGLVLAIVALRLCFRALGLLAQAKDVSEGAEKVATGRWVAVGLLLLGVLGALYSGLMVVMTLMFLGREWHQ